MDVTRIIGLLNEGQSVPIARLKVQPHQETLLSQDIVILSGENEEQEKLIDDALAFALVDKMRRLQGIVERLENLQVTAQFASASPVSQVLVNLPSEPPQEGGQAIPLPVTLIEASEDSPATNSSAAVEFLLSSVFGNASFFNPIVVGGNVNLIV
ncbi:MAG: hypothetical protein HY788_01475 [Deltaproteobacteria bacterium]|nr:hypothetical protein [Deltaproteobacteria bacterium]